MKFSAADDRIIARLWGVASAAEIATAIGRPGRGKAVRQRGRIQLGLGVGALGPGRPSGRKPVEAGANTARRIQEMREGGASWPVIREATGIAEDAARRIMNTARRSSPRLPAAKAAPGSSSAHPRLARPSWFKEDAAARLVAGR